jgi:hypothetical protein
MAEAKPQSQQDTPEDNARGWTTEPVGDNATMKDASHKEYEAHDTAPPKDPGPGGGKQAPEDVGESTTRRGEDVHRQEGRDFEETGKNAVGRPIGKSDPEAIGIDGQKPIDEDMPDLQHP